jgi:hypothetical protein
VADVGENDLFNSCFLSKERNRGNLKNIVFDHEKDEVHFGPRKFPPFLLFLKKTNAVKNLWKVGVDPDGIVRFRGCPRNRKAHKVKPCFNELGHPILRKSHPTGYKSYLRSLFLDKPDALRKILVKQGFPPTFEDYGLNVLQIGKKFFEILKRYILILPVWAFCADAHLASERTSRRQFNLPC